MSITQGDWSGSKKLDGKDVTFINPYLEDDVDPGNPFPLKENAKRIFKGIDYLGDGFLLSHSEADTMALNHTINKDVIHPTINGQELNNDPEQKPGRMIIDFQNWSEEHSRQYILPFSRVESLVKPIRATNNRQIYRERWWLHGENRPGLRAAITDLAYVFVAAATTKYLNFSALPTNYVFLKTIYVFTTDRWDLYCLVQSTLHDFWARKYSGSLETRLAFSPTDCFETFPFPEGLWQTANPTLADIGERYHEHRRALMQQLWLGLTDIYNLFHTRDLTPEKVAKVSKKTPEQAQAGYQGLLELRRLHVQLDTAVRDAYGWQDLDLGHDFHEVETLPENDRVRYTISPAARKEVLKRLLAENHRRATDQSTSTPEKPKAKRGKKAKSNEDQIDIFQ